MKRGPVKIVLNVNSNKAKSIIEEIRTSFSDKAEIKLKNINKREVLEVEFSEEGNMGKIIGELLNRISKGKRRIYCNLSCLTFKGAEALILSKFYKEGKFNLINSKALKDGFKFLIKINGEEHHIKIS